MPCVRWQFSHVCMVIEFFLKILCDYLLESLKIILELCQSPYSFGHCWLGQVKKIFTISFTIRIIRISLDMPFCFVIWLNLWWRTRRRNSLEPFLWPLPGTGHSSQWIWMMRMSGGPISMKCFLARPPFSSQCCLGWTCLYLDHMSSWSLLLLGGI